MLHQHPPKKRGGYNCGRCGLPKKGHVCSAPAAADPTTPSPGPHRLRRALSFDDADGPADENADADAAAGSGALTASCLAEILRRLPPKELMAAAAVCKGWRDVVNRVWCSAEEIKLRVTARSHIAFVGSVLRKCEELARLTLTMESDVDATVLACVAFSCPNLEAFDMNIMYNPINRITGDELGRFVSEKHTLQVLKIEGCTNLGSLNLYSLSLSIIRLSNLHCISKSVINCPNLKEISLDFTQEENDSTDIIAMMDCLGRTCPCLRKIHIASVRLCNEAVLALTGANLRDLLMLSLVLGSKITDASVAAIVSSYTSLELLDLSGSSISDNGVGMICNVLPQTLSRLLLAFCTNITSSGIQFAAAQLPFLQLFDCGMSICDPSLDDESIQDNSLLSAETKLSQKLESAKAPPIYQKLIIKHGRLKKLSLWGCSGLDALYLNCPDLNDLNLNFCTNLNPETLVIECPSLENIHAAGCQDMLIGAIREKVHSDFSILGTHFQCKRFADCSKRVQVPQFPLQQLSNEKRKRVWLTQCNVHLIS